MLQIAKFYLNNKALPIYISQVPTNAKTLEVDELFYVLLSELLNFYDLDLPPLDPFDEQSVVTYTQFVHTHISQHYLANSRPGYVSGNFFLGWRSYFGLDDLLPKDEKDEFFWMGTKIEDYITNYTGCIRQAFKNNNLISVVPTCDKDGNEFKESRFITTRLSLAALHRMTTIESLADTLENPYSFGICAKDYQADKTSYLTEDELAVAMSKLLRQKIDRRKLCAMLLESSLLEVNQAAKTKRYKLTEIGMNYAIDRPRTWHKSVIQLLENKGIN